MRQNLNGPWVDGPTELIQHAVDHLDAGGDFDRRIAMVSIDNAVELAIKTYLGLPERIRGSKGPSRKEFAECSESFPLLLDLLQKYSSDRIVDFSLEDIEWYHRIRNQLYHSGNGITVELSKVETYLELGIILFKNLFGTNPSITKGYVLNSKIGQFLQLWNAFEDELRGKLPPKQGPAYYQRMDYLYSLNREAGESWKSLVMFRSELVFGLSEIGSKEIEANIAELKRLSEMVKKLPNDDSTST